jgi:hypothetical protein
LLSVTTKLADLFGGAALAQANTFGGTLQQLANSAGDAAENIAEFGTQNSLLIAGLQEGRKALDEYNAEIDAADGFWSKLGNTLSPVFTVVGKFVPAFDLSRQALNLFNDVVGEDTPEAIDKATAAAKRLQSALSIEKAVESTLEQLRKLGVVLDQDVNDQFEKNADLLLRTDELYRRGIITRREFESTQAAVAEANRKLTDTLVVQVDALELSESGTLTYAEALRIARADLDGLTEAEIRNGNETVAQSERRRAARAQERDDSLLGENTPSGGTFFIPAGVRVAQNGIFGAPLARL